MKKPGIAHARHDDDIPSLTRENVLLIGAGGSCRRGIGGGAAATALIGRTAAHKHRTREQTQENQQNVCPFHSPSNLYQKRKHGKHNFKNSFGWLLLLAA
jgi:hypothetical protein